MDPVGKNAKFCLFLNFYAIILFSNKYIDYYSSSILKNIYIKNHIFWKKNTYLCVTKGKERKGCHSQTFLQALIYIKDGDP